MRIVLDTNVFVSALLSRHGPPANLFNRWNDDEYELVTSPEQIVELQRVLEYPRIAKYIASEQAATLLTLLEEAILVAVELPEIDLSPDPDDNVILATAIAGKAQLVVSGDKKHMLSIGDVQGIPIVAPAEAIKRLNKQRN